MLSFVESQKVLSTHPKTSSHPARNAQQTPLGQNLKNHESDDGQGVLDLSREDPRHCCPEQGMLSTEFCVYGNQNLQSRALQQDGAGRKGVRDKDSTQKSRRSN